jgi:hypothetical protein
LVRKIQSFKLAALSENDRLKKRAEQGKARGKGAKERAIEEEIALSRAFARTRWYWKRR